MEDVVKALFFRIENPMFKAPNQIPPIKPPAPLINDHQMTNPQHLEFIQLPISTFWEVDPNKYDFYITNENNQRTLIEPRIIRNIIAYAYQENAPFMEMWMVPKTGGPPVPAHLPSFETIAQLYPQSASSWFEWFRAVDTSEEIVMDPQFGFLADPAPMLPQRRPTYLLNEKGVVLDIAAVSNALYIGNIQSSYHVQLHIWVEVFKNEENNRKMIRVKATPLTETVFSRKENKFVNENTTTPEDWGEIHSSGYIDAPTTFMVWNTRGISRPMFETNLSHLRKNHYPHIMLLTETKVSKNQAQHIVQGLPYFNAYHCVKPVGISGGMVLLWNSSWFDFNNIDMEDEQQSVTINGIVQVANARSNEAGPSS